MGSLEEWSSCCLSGIVTENNTKNNPGTKSQEKKKGESIQHRYCVTRQHGKEMYEASSSFVFETSCVQFSFTFHPELRFYAAT